ncbi:MAG: phage virion morphogenesis protein [Pseudomonadota bacterium]
MAGIALEYTTTDLAGAMQKLRRLETADRLELSEAIGARLEGSAQERIATTKVSPDGDPWAEWSANYHPGRQGASLLHREGDLRDSLLSRATADEVIVGANRVYAAIHQMGGDEDQGHPPIPARPYLGVSPEDERFIRDRAVDFLSEPLR